MVVVLYLEEQGPDVLPQQLLILARLVRDLLDLRVPLLEDWDRIVDEDPEEKQDVENRAAASDMALLFLLPVVVDALHEVPWEDINERKYLRHCSFLSWFY